MKIWQKIIKTSYHLTWNAYNPMKVNKLRAGKMVKIDLTGSYLILPHPT